MITQDHVWMWTLVGIGVVMLAFVFVIANAGKQPHRPAPGYDNRPADR